MTGLVLFARSTVTPIIGVVSSVEQRAGGREYPSASSCLVCRSCSVKEWPALPVYMVPVYLKNPSDWCSYYLRFSRHDLA